MLAIFMPLTNFHGSVSDQSDHSNQRLGVIVSHTFQKHGCCFDNRHSTPDEGDERCYLCHNNPFYEVSFHVGQDSVPVSPLNAFGCVVEVGACLLLKASAIAIIISGFRLQDQPLPTNSCFKGDRKHLQRMRKMRMMVSSDPEASDLSSTPNISNNKRQRLGEEEEEDNETWVQSYLNVTSAMHAKDGFICVAVQTSGVRLRNAIKQIQNLYVRPQDLKMVSDDDEHTQLDWQQAVPYIVVN